MSSRCGPTPLKLSIQRWNSIQDNCLFQGIQKQGQWGFPGPIKVEKVGLD